MIFLARNAFLKTLKIKMCIIEANFEKDDRNFYEKFKLILSVSSEINISLLFFLNMGVCIIPVCMQNTRLFYMSLWARNHFALRIDLTSANTLIF